MNTVTFLEQLANNTFCNEENQQIITQQKSKLQKALTKNNLESIKNGFSPVAYWANGVTVIEV